MFGLFNFIIAVVLGVIDSFMGDVAEATGGFGILGSIYSLFVFLPGLAVAVRRLHDINKSGWWIFIVLVPLIGIIIYFIFLVMPGTPGRNEFGPDPLGRKGRRRPRYDDDDDYDDDEDDRPRRSRRRRDDDYDDDDEEETGRRSRRRRDDDDDDDDYEDDRPRRSRR